MKPFLKPSSWLLILVVLSLSLAACGGESVSETTTSTAPETTNEEPVADVSGAEEAASDEPATEEAEADDAEAETSSSQDENLLSPDQPLAAEVVCQSVDVPDNTLVAQVSDSDWSIGPADAPITIIEYGDFQ